MAESERTNVNVTYNCVLQQLYVYAGLLIIYAALNTFPLSSLTRLVRLGAVWQVAGEPNHA